MLGYLLLENGIFIFGLLLLEAMPFLVEIGVLLDLFVGMFVMGIIIHHINREFASLDTRRLCFLEGITMLLGLILFPCWWRRVAFAVPSNRWRPWLLAPTASAHLALDASRSLRHAGAGWSGLAGPRPAR